MKITTLRDRDVLAAKHTASLQLLCTAGGNQARLDARSEFEISQRSLKGGGEAGREHRCRRVCSYVKRAKRPLIFFDLEVLIESRASDPISEAIFYTIIIRKKVAENLFAVCQDLSR